MLRALVITAIIVATPLLVPLWSEVGAAQGDLDAVLAQVGRAAKALEGLPKCSREVTDQCYYERTVQTNDFIVTASLVRQRRPFGTESTDVGIEGKPGEAEARQQFESTAAAVRTGMSPPPQHYAHEVFAAVAGQNESGVMRVWLDRVASDDAGRAEAFFVCGNLIGQLRLLVPRGTGPGGQAVVEEARRQVKLVTRHVTDVLLYGNACQPGTAQGVNLGIRQIFLVQVVQNLRRDIPLVAGKRTAVRVIVDLAGAQFLEGVKVTLRGTSANGQPLSLTPLVDVFKAVTVHDLNEEDLTQSATFIIPGEQANGSVTLEAEVFPPAGARDIYAPNNTATGRFQFRERPGLFVGVVPACYEDVCVTPDLTTDTLMEKIFPVADSGIKHERLPTTFPLDDELARLLRFSPRGHEALKKEIRKFFHTTLGTKPDQLVVVLPRLLWLPSLGSSDPLWNGGEGRTALVQQHQEPQEVDPQHLLAHEIAHNLGLRHTGLSQSNRRRTGPQQFDGLPCSGHADAMHLGERRPPGARETDWPFPDGHINSLGFDPHAGKVKPVREAYDVMTYCSPPRDDIWISEHHYKKLLEWGLKPHALAPRRTSLAERLARLGLNPSRAEAASQSQFLVISGMAARDGSRVQLDPAYRITDNGPGSPQDPNGNYCLRFTGSSGSSSFCFTLTFFDHQMQPIEEQGFSLKVPYPASTARVAVLRDGRELGVLTASRHAPTVKINAPRRGEPWTGTQALTWSARDQDGGTLAYAVLYTPNQGETWYPLKLDATEARFSVDTRLIAGGDQIYFRVLATDGMNTSAADVGPVKVLGQVPAPRGPVAVPGTALPQATGGWGPIVLAAGSLLLFILTLKSGISGSRRGT